MRLSSRSVLYSAGQGVPRRGQLREPASHPSPVREPARCEPGPRMLLWQAGSSSQKLLAAKLL